MSDDPKKLPVKGNHKPNSGSFVKGDPRAGRKPGIPNGITSDIRKMIVAALDKAGGEKYLVEQARENPVAFLSLVGKVVPREVNARIEHIHTREEVEAILRGAGLDPAAVWQNLH